MRLKLDIIPDKIIDHYTLRDLVDKDRWVYIEICKGMYGLPQSGILANQLLEKHLAKKGTINANTPPASGGTCDAASSSVSMSTTLASKSHTNQT
jgi:hypothetical protein